MNPQVMLAIQVVSICNRILERKALSQTKRAQAEAIKEDTLFMVKDLDVSEWPSGLKRALRENPNPTPSKGFPLSTSKGA